MTFTLITWTFLNPTWKLFFDPVSVELDNIVQYVNMCDVLALAIFYGHKQIKETTQSSGK